MHLYIFYSQLLPQSNIHWKYPLKCCQGKLWIKFPFLKWMLEWKLLLLLYVSMSEKGPSQKLHNSLSIDVFFLFYVRIFFPFLLQQNFWESREWFLAFGNEGRKWIDGKIYVLGNKCESEWAQKWEHKNCNNWE